MRNVSWPRVAVGAAVLSTVLLAGFTFVSAPAGAVRPLATAVLRNAAGADVGTIVFKGSGANAERAEVQIALPAGAPGLGSYHGLHVHGVGTCDGSTTPPFTSAGGHWNLVADAKHGHHTGDLPAVLVAPDGTASAEFETHRFDIGQLFDGDGSAIVLHAGADNFGNVPLAADRYADPANWYNAQAGTGATGDAGSRYGCGVLERS